VKIAVTLWHIAHLSNHPFRNRAIIVRNKQLDNLLYTLAYDRGHSAGADEVDSIYKSLCAEFKGIDALLPHTMPANFKVGDKVIVWNEKAVIENVVKDTNGYSYDVSMPAYDGNTVTVPEEDISLPSKD
jgi:hypothetical protein